MAQHTPFTVGESRTC